jgi:hypothetical protein
LASKSICLSSMDSHKPHLGQDLRESVHDLVLVTPTWTTQSWWAELSQLTMTTWPIPSSQKLTAWHIYPPTTSTPP